MGYITEIILQFILKDILKRFILCLVGIVLKKINLWLQRNKKHTSIRRKKSSKIKKEFKISLGSFELEKKSTYEYDEEETSGANLYLFQKGLKPLFLCTFISNDVKRNLFLFYFSF